MAKVTIIMPVRDRAANTKKLLDELIRQKKDYPDTQILAMENASTEDMSFLDEYSKDDVTVKHYKKAGIFHAYNRALKLATGDYICFIDNDDRIPDYYLRVIHEHVVTGKDWYVWDWYSDDTFADMSGVDLKHPLRLNWAMWGYCFNRKMFDGITFNEKVFVGDDVRVMFQIITEDTEGEYIPETMYYFWFNGNDNSASHIWNRDHEPTGPKE